MCVIWNSERKGESTDEMEVQEVFPLNPSAPRFSVAVSNGSVMVVPLSQVDSSPAQLHQIPTHVLNEQVGGKVIKIYVADSLSIL